MTRAELIMKIRAYRRDYALEELEDSDAERLERLLILEAHSEIGRHSVSQGRSIHSWKRGDEPPELTDSDGETPVWPFPRAKREEISTFLVLDSAVEGRTCRTPSRRS